MGGECDSQPRSPRGQGKGDGCVSPRDPPRSSPLRAPLAVQGPVMAAACVDPAQVSGPRFGHCVFFAGSETAPGVGWRPGRPLNSSLSLSFI